MKKKGKIMFQVVLTVAASKRLIARAVAAHPAVQTALRSGTIVIIAGTTNGYIAEELLAPSGHWRNLTAGAFSAA